MPNSCSSRSSERIPITAHPHQLARDALGRTRLDAGDAAVRQPHDAVRHRRDGRVVGDDDSRGNALRVDSRERLEHDDAGGDVEGARWARRGGAPLPLGDGAGDRHALLLSTREVNVAAAIGCLVGVCQVDVAVEVTSLVATSRPPRRACT
jgi:hypothetical protein